MAANDGFQFVNTAANFEGGRIIEIEDDISVAAANRVFSPTSEEVAEARAIVEAFDAALAKGIGAIQVDGKLVDGPIVDDARRVVALARAGGGGA